MRRVRGDGKGLGFRIHCQDPLSVSIPPGVSGDLFGRPAPVDRVPRPAPETPGKPSGAGVCADGRPRGPGKGRGRSTPEQGLDAPRAGDEPPPVGKTVAVTPDGVRLRGGERVATDTGPVLLLQIVEGVEVEVPRQRPETRVERRPPRGERPRPVTPRP